jgi:hypothetical protein
LTEDDISSVAEATDWTLFDASSAAEATIFDRLSVLPAVVVSERAEPSSSRADDDTV